MVDGDRDDSTLRRNIRAALVQTKSRTAAEKTVVYAGRRALLRPAADGQAIDLVRPSTDDYALEHGDLTYFSQWRQEAKLWEPVFARIDALSKNGYKPFFVESGALDGERNSNTLFMERSRKWSGLLVEPSDNSFRRLVARHRKAWAFHGCLSPTTESAQLKFYDNGLGTSSSQMDLAGTSHEILSPAEP